MQTAESSSPEFAEPALRCLQPADAARYAALWRDGLAQHGHFFREDAADEPSPAI